MLTQLWQEVGDAEPTQGITMAAMLTLPDELRTFLGWMVRRRAVPLREVCDHLDGAQDDCAQLLLALQAKGLVQTVDCGGEPCYQVWLVLQSRRSASPDILRALED
jgi:hypothetical protein